MATSSSWSRTSTRELNASALGAARRGGYSGSPYSHVFVDGVTVVCAVMLALTSRYGISPFVFAYRVWNADAIRGVGIFLLPVALVLGFLMALSIISWRLQLYSPDRFHGYMHEQRLSAEACLTAGLLLNGSLYLIHAEYVPRSVVLTSIGLTTIMVCGRRMLQRSLLHRRHKEGIATRNVLIVGTGLDARAVRQQIEHRNYLGFRFKGFISYPGQALEVRIPDDPEVLGSTDELFELARIHFVDEIFLTATHERGIVRHLLDGARKHGINLRVIPDLYDGLAWDRSVEFIGQCPTIPLHRGHLNDFARAIKRILDVIVASTCLVLAAIPMLVIAILIRLDSEGAVFYCSDRVGLKGRIFKCTKFRTMVTDAEKRRTELNHMNERDGVLFKISNDPRVTRLGRILRKYSLDELPQLFDVLRGDMSLVGPRPPLASEVQKYKPDHLRRLGVTPGITGLWQVQARQDPSFDSYISLDLLYVENWSVWLDIKILFRTLAVVLEGTGS